MSRQIDVLSQVRRTIEAHDLIAPGAGIVVGVSGGPDSLCLLHVLFHLRETYDLQLHVAHLNHGARGTEADADAAFVAAIADEWGLPATVEKRDVPAIAQMHRLAFEEAARRVRYAFLARVAKTVGANRVAVGHNADDQAETVLMHVLRGAGLAGLRGMLPRMRMTDYRMINAIADQPIDQPITLIRPLLEVQRSAIERYCADRDLVPRFDRSNLDTTYFRNRLRHELLPMLETYNPNMRSRLCHAATVVAADYELLAQAREQAWAQVVREERDEAVVFETPAWQALPVALQRATLRQAAYRLRNSLRDVDFVHIENARQIALTGKTGAQAMLPMGLSLTVGYETLTVGDSGDAGPPPDEPLLWQAEPLPVEMPGTTPIPQSTWVLQAEMLGTWDRASAIHNPDPWLATLDADALAGELLLRPRQQGDRFRPQGMEGHSVKLNAFMINVKIPKAWRDHVPLLTSGGKIVWVCGRRISEDAAIGPETRRVARLRFERER